MFSCRTKLAHTGPFPHARTRFDSPRLAWSGPIFYRFGNSGLSFGNASEMRIECLISCRKSGFIGGNGDSSSRPPNAAGRATQTFLHEEDEKRPNFGTYRRPRRFAPARFPCGHEVALHSSCNCGTNIRRLTRDACLSNNAAQGTHTFFNTRRVVSAESPGKIPFGGWNTTRQ
ncbi:hypothetical protein BDV19DRAFT_368392 [Aspergillus venezuelensis]